MQGDFAVFCSRFIWVIPNFESKRGPVYSRKFTAKTLQWYLGVDFEGPDQHAGVYLFAEGHSRRVDFKLILFNLVVCHCVFFAFYNASCTGARDVLGVWHTGRGVDGWVGGWVGGGVFWKFWVGGCPNTAPHHQGKGRVSREVRIGQAGRGRAQGGDRPMGAAAYGGKGFKGRAAVSGERPMGASSCRQQHDEVSCHPHSTFYGC